MNFGGNLKVVPADYETFQLNVEEADKYITERTKAVIITQEDHIILSALQPDTIAKRFSQKDAFQEREAQGGSL